MAGFGDKMDRMDAAIMASLNDGSGSYFDSAGALVAQDIPLIIDHNLEYVGANGVFLSDAVGITWQTSDVAGVARGGFFEFDSVRYTVEKVIADDGGMSTAACMVVP